MIQFLSLGLKRRNGYWHQFSRNAVHLSRGSAALDPTVPLYADVAQQIGLQATDWSWSVLIDDYSLDGNADVFITNGIMGRSNDMDYIKFVSAESQQAVLSRFADSTAAQDLASRMPIVKLRNRYFEAGIESELAFSGVEVGAAGFSHGAVLLDIDNDGDRDIVTSDVNGLPQVLLNQTDPDSTQSMGLVLRGGSLNPEAIGARVRLSLGEPNGDTSVHVADVRRVRGFLSSSDPRLLFGIPPGFDSPPH